MGITLKVDRSKPEKGYTIISNHIIKDNRLTFKARGILSMLLSLPPHPRNLSIESIAKQSQDGVSAVRSGIEELKIIGYLDVQQKYNARGQYDGVEWNLRDNPCGSEKLEKAREITDAENPNSDQPPSEKQRLINTYKTKKPKNKKTTTTTIEKSVEILEDLRFSATMLAETQIQVRKALEQVAPCDRQRMLDDFCAAVRSGVINKSQLGWLHGVIKRYRNGEYNFKPLPPVPVSTSHAARSPDTDSPAPSVDTSTVKSAERSSVALESLKKLKKQICRPN
ncbi:MAG: phage replication protein [Pseudomonas sp.]